MALLAGQPGAALAAYRSLALTAGNGLGMGPNRLQGLLPPFPQTPHPLHPHVATGVEELLVWQGSPDAAAPLDALAQLRQTSCVPVPAVLQWWLDVVLSLCPLPEPTVRHPDVGAMPGPWAEFPDTTVRQPWPDISATMIDLLLDIIDGTPRKSVVLPTTLVVRESA